MCIVLVNVCSVFMQLHSMIKFDLILYDYIGSCTIAGSFKSVGAAILLFSDKRLITITKKVL